MRQQIKQNWIASHLEFLTKSPCARGEVEFIPTHSPLSKMDVIRKVEKEIIIKAPWGKIAALSWGNPTSPPVLLCHGKLDAASGFRPLVRLLPNCFYYVSIDLPGNGRSDHLPAGVRYSAADLVPSLLYTVKHFNWDKFIYIGHSLGVPVGKIFNIAYPGYITRTVELDPIPAHHTWPSNRQGLYDWYHRYYSYYNEDKYAKHNGGVESAPKYTYEKALELVMSSRNLPKEAAEHVLERCLETTGDGLYRFTFDQRMKDVTILPFSPESLRNIYTTTITPTLCIIAKNILNEGIYDQVEFLLKENDWCGCYKVIVVDGWHDVHIANPGCMAEDIAKFLMDDVKAKL